MPLLSPRKGLRFLDAAALLAVIAVLSTVSLYPRSKVEVVGSVGGEEQTIDPDLFDSLDLEGGQIDAGTLAALGIGADGSQVERRPGEGPLAGAGSDPDGVALGSGSNAPQGAGVGAGSLECAAGKNGGATDAGVTGTSLKLGATVVESGLGQSFLGDVRWGMRAVVDRVNREGGICGRQIELLLKDDGWDASTGFQFIRDLVEGEKVFALAVVPSSEGLRLASVNGYLQRQGVPVVGTDGMLISQYTDPEIFPVAAATISSMHIIAEWAFKQFGGNKNNFWPSIVYDSRFRFGKEGAFAFNEAVKRLTGRALRAGFLPGQSDDRCSSTSPDPGRLCGIPPDEPGYGTPAGNFNAACRESGDVKACNFTVFLLEPQTAKVWLQSGGRFHGKGAVPQPLFNRRFAEDCAARCTNVVAWTGYIPPIEGFENQPAVAKYVNEVRATNERADRTNTFVQGGYVGMTLLVEALERVGPNVTREALKSALLGMTLDSGLSRPLSWKAQDRFANRCMMGFELRNDGSRFTGYRLASDFTCDSKPQAGIPPNQ